jgi:hypothetical protein
LLLTRRTDFEFILDSDVGRSIEKENSFDDSMCIFICTDGFVLNVFLALVVSPVVAQLGVNEILIDAGKFLAPYLGKISLILSLPFGVGHL